MPQPNSPTEFPSIFFITSKAPLFSFFSVRTKMSVIVNSRMGFIMLILITSLLALVISERIPEISITREPQLKEGDVIPLFANKLLRHGNYCEAYSYYELPFCPPGEPIPNRKKSLEEILSGDCFTRTRYKLKFKVRTVRELLCEKTLTKDEVKKFRQAAADGSKYHMYYNNILLRGKVGFVKPMRVTVNSRPRYYLVKHIDFYSQYYKNQVVDIKSISDLASAVDITEDAEIRVRFTYSIFWKDSIIKPAKSISQNETATMKQWWSSEEKGLLDPRLMFLVLNLCLWLGMFCHCRSRSGPNSIDASWHPANLRLLATILGVGLQLLIMACFLFIWFWDFHDVQYPCNLGPMATLVLTCCFICLCYGYNDSSQSSGCKHNICSWIKFISYYVLMLIIVVVVNEVAMLAFESANWRTTAIFFTVYRVLAFFFSPRHIDIADALQYEPRRPVIYWWQSMFMTTTAQMFLGGLLPFIAIYGKMDEIYAIFFLLKLCGVYSTMLSSFFMVIIVTTLMGAIFTTYQLYGEHFNWEWRSVLRGGSTAIFMFAYGIYFYYRVNKEISFLNLFYFLVYNASLCCIFFVALGAVGFYASSFAFLAYEHLFLLKSN